MATIDNMEFYLIQPVEATNEVSNPSSETNQTGKTASGAGVSIARSSTYQRRGLYSDEVTTASGVESGIYFGTVNEVSGVARTFSADVFNTSAGQAMRIQIRTTAGAVLSETTFTSTGYWQRPSVTRTGTANTTRRLYVVRDSVVSTAKFYVDGWYYSTVNGTYLDGDMVGFVKNQKHYRWLGTPHASQSWRSGQTTSGGTLLRIKDYAKIQAVLGLGMAPVLNSAQPTSLDYSSYQTTRVMDRDIIFSMAFTGLTPGAIQVNRQAIVNAVRPDKTVYRQPLVIRYQGLATAGTDSSEPVDVYCHYVDGLENLPQIPGVERVNLRFRQYLPYLVRDGDSGAALGMSSSVANAAYLLYRTTAGVWTSLGVVNGAVYALAQLPNGYILAGGAFTSIGGVAANRIAYYDGSAWNAFGAGADNTVRAIAVTPSGTFYIGGAFHNAGGVAVNHVAYYNGAAFAALGAGTVGVDADVFALTFAENGNVYMAGSFANAGGSASAGAAGWTGTAWVLMPGLVGAAVKGTGVVARGSRIYVGGEYVAAGPGFVQYWNGASWTDTSVPTSTAPCLAIGVDGMLYAGAGDGGLASSRAILQKWNGSTWTSLGTFPLLSSPGQNIHALAVGYSGEVYLAGSFYSTPTGAIPGRFAVLQNGFYSPPDAEVGVFGTYAILPTADGRLYVGGDWTTTPVPSATVTVPALTSVRAYPVITWTGPGTVWQARNYTTGKCIWFTGLTLLAGETATLDLRPGKYSFTSSFRGNMNRYIVSGSDLDWYLTNGNNNVSAYMSGTTGASSITMTWQDLYWSLDGAKR